MSNALSFPIELVVPRGRGASASLHRQLRDAILEGRLATGFRLPATRDLASMLGVARATVVVGYDMLVAEGYVAARHGDGTFVQAIRRAKVIHPDSSPSAPKSLVRTPRFDLRLGFPDISLFPFDVWRRMESRAWRSITSYGPELRDPAGLPHLRAEIVGHASASRAVSCSVDDVVVTAGAQQAFDLLARTLVSKPGTIVAVEDPGYTPARSAFAQAGAMIVGVPVDDNGIDVSQIPAAARIICVTPSHQFPLGVAMSPERRSQLLNHARRTGAYIVEDDYDCEYRYDSRPLDALQTLAPGIVCYVGTFSKTMFPALRLGYAIVPDLVRDRLLQIRQLADGFGAPAPQAALAEFINKGHLRRHVRRMQRVYAERRAGLLDGLHARLDGRAVVLPSKAGLHFSVRLLGNVDWPAISWRAEANELAFERCARYAMAETSEFSCAIGFGSLKDSQINAITERLSIVFG